jgi:hypothetical protein
VPEVGGGYFGGVKLVKSLIWALWYALAHLPHLGIWRGGLSILASDPQLAAGVTCAVLVAGLVVSLGGPPLGVLVLGWMAFVLAFHFAGLLVLGWSLARRVDEQPYKDPS